MMMLLTTLGLGALAPLLTAAAGWLMAIGAPVAGAAGLLARQVAGPKLKLILIAVAILAAVITVIGFTAHYERLKQEAADFAALQPKIAALEHELGCDGRDDSERDLFACIPARDRDASAAKAAAISKQQEDFARALDLERKRADDNAADLEFANNLILNSSAADDAPLPKVMKDNWTRDRSRRGAK